MHLPSWFNSITHFTILQEKKQGRMREKMKFLSTNNINKLKKHIARNYCFKKVTHTKQIYLEKESAR